MKTGSQYQKNAGKRWGAFTGIPINTILIHCINFKSVTKV